MMETNWKQQRESYLNQRVKSQIAWYGNKSTLNKKWYYGCRITIIISGALIPLLVGYANGPMEYLKYAAGALGALVAISEGIMTLRKYRENWSNYRRTAEALNREQLLYENGVGDEYSKDDEAAFKYFIVRIEKITASENDEWTSQLETEAKA